MNHERLFHAVQNAIPLVWIDPNGPTQRIEKLVGIVLPTQESIDVILEGGGEAIVLHTEISPYFENIEAIHCIATENNFEFCGSFHGYTKNKYVCVVDSDGDYFEFLPSEVFHELEEHLMPE